MKICIAEEDDFNSNYPNVESRMVNRRSLPPPRRPTTRPTVSLAASVRRSCVLIYARIDRETMPLQHLHHLKHNLSRHHRIRPGCPPQRYAHLKFMDSREYLPRLVYDRMQLLEKGGNEFRRRVNQVYPVRSAECDRHPVAPCGSRILMSEHQSIFIPSFSRDVG